MNRAILVVICDFLVSAMLSMMTGMVPSHTGGTGVGLDENTTQVLLAQLDAGKKELERVRRELREAAEKLGTRQHDAQLREIVSAVSIPAVAIGGISYDNVCEIKGSSVSGVAVVSAIFGSEDIEEATMLLKERVKAVVEE